MRDKFMILLIIIVLCFSLAACSSGDAVKVDMYELQKSMIDADGNGDAMSTVNGSAENAAELFSYLSDVEYDKVEDFFLAYSSSGMADEIAVVQMKSSSDVKEMTDSLETHVDERVSLYNTYEPEQAARAEKAVVFSEGNFAVLIMSDNQDAVKTAFENAIKQ